jgi:hypothetical protein
MSKTTIQRSAISYRELKELLLELGFLDASKPGLPRFEFAETGTILLFRAYRSHERVFEKDMVFVRRQLVDNGLIDADAFDRFHHHKATA